MLCKQLSCAWFLHDFCQLEYHLTTDGKQRIILLNGDDKFFDLTFQALLLIECGFPIPNFTCGYIQHMKEVLHPSKFEYIQNYIENPRPLKLGCRDVLRHHYKGRIVHQFVEKSNLPQSLKDFILLKPLLKYVPKDLLTVRKRIFRATTVQLPIPRRTFCARPVRFCLLSMSALLLLFSIFVNFISPA